MMLLRRTIFLIADFRLPIFGTQSALASFLERLSQTRNSKFKIQNSKMGHLQGGEA